MHVMHVSAVNCFCPEGCFNDGEPGHATKLSCCTNVCGIDFNDKTCREKCPCYHQVSKLHNQVRNITSKWDYRQKQLSQANEELRQLKVDLAMEKEKLNDTLEKYKEISMEHECLIALIAPLAVFALFLLIIVFYNCAFCKKKSCLSKLIKVYKYNLKKHPIALSEVNAIGSLSNDDFSHERDHIPSDQTLRSNVDSGYVTDMKTLETYLESESTHIKSKLSKGWLSSAGQKSIPSNCFVRTKSTSECSDLMEHVPQNATSLDVCFDTNEDPSDFQSTYKAFANSSEFKMAVLEFEKH